MRHSFSAKLGEMMQHVVLLGLCWFSHFTASVPVDIPPGIVVRESPSGLAFASDFGAKFFLANYIRYGLRGTPDVEKCFFDVCSLQNYTIKNYVPPTSNVTFERGIGIVWNVTGAEFDLCFDFELKTTGIDERASVRGNVRLHLSGLSLAAEIAIGRGKDDTLLVSLTECSVDVDVSYKDMNATWEGNSAKHLKELFDKEIHGYLEARVNESVTTVIRNLTRLVAGVIPDSLTWMNKELARHAGFTLDTRLVREPILKPEYLEVAFRAEFRVVGDKLGASFQPPHLDLPSPKSSMLSVFVSEYVTNTLLDVFFKKNWLAVNITKDFLPYTYRSLFNTTCEHVCFGTMFPEIAAKCPNVSAIFEIRATSRPRVTFSFWYQISHIDFDLDIVVPGVNGSEGTVAKLSVSVSAWKTVFMSNERIMGRVSNPNITITDRGSSEEFAAHLARFNYVVQLITDWILVPHANLIGSIGFPLYLPFGLRLVHSELSIIPGAIGFSTDVTYDASPRKDHGLW